METDLQSVLSSFKIKIYKVPTRQMFGAVILFYQYVTPNGVIFKFKYWNRYLILFYQYVTLAEFF
jgi:hypothetical protein